ncbi:hypothetical protein SD77_4073 [Bacillus badius]|uniref:Ribose 5-phosphate isomerase B n=1 Tax=Bacillus badius TaxID=1455 RepID=A0ABR5AVY7_BACBA|nr:hypothetical protein SD78_0379 [Bacillus badius]KIL78393.1 hypothetical protein SD77_4073 [Bacillus badius]
MRLHSNFNKINSQIILTIFRYLFPWKRAIFVKMMVAISPA